ncbi:glycosyltransferase family 2 protein [Kibdelosporangium philippinense]|uniref:Glycosyltransferase family 2 protein n=1 Tax=Kibdelosporangium philippinense TaxID=211113 RepID=A0ABS8Z9V6_9PSEU|nr:glycosyltransferase family A protein [Kibdelosporangium philippinense]MCE7003446.1 glycosyltransferase family 2 protein [Kibdelosporangium philippinense]
MNATPPGPVAETTNHVSSHRKLVTDGVIARPAEINAIIVPTARTVGYLRTAMELARAQGCILVVLCSKRASAEAAFRLARDIGTEILAVDLPRLGLAKRLLPAFHSSAILRGTRFDRHTDTSTKRNLGLLLALVAKYDRILFLDDDISVPRVEDLNEAAGLLDDYHGVGLSIGGFWDNSVVCHAFRDSGGAQDTFIGGGALAIGQRSYDSFFPNVYNEDWFFLLGDNGLRPSAMTGQVKQQPYDPYRDGERARSEEFGDTLAEGLFSLLTNGKDLTGATEAYWRHFLRKRRAFIDEVLEMAMDADMFEAERSRMITALKAARGRNALIEPEFCVRYLEAWRADRRIWQKHVAQVQHRYHRGGLEKLLADIGLMHCYRGAA